LSKPVAGWDRSTRTSALARTVAFQDLDPLKVLCQDAGHRQPTDSRSDHYRTLTQETAHVATLLQVRIGQMTARLLRRSFNRGETRYIGNIRIAPTGYRACFTHPPASR
jgi:hypothetical protein